MIRSFQFVRPDPLTTKEGSAGCPEITMFTLYYAPNTCALASHIALVEAGAPYALKLVDFGKTEQRQPDYLKVNPKARVPSLVTPRGILTETPAMLAFTAQSLDRK